MDKAKNTDKKYGYNKKDFLNLMDICTNKTKLPYLPEYKIPENQNIEDDEENYKVAQNKIL